jgi:ABC-2 type transport system permease protein
MTRLRQGYGGHAWLARWLDVDAAQWWGLTRAFLKIDFAALRGAQGKGAARTMAVGLLLTAVVYGLSGIMPAIIVFASPDALFGATVMVTVVGFFIASSLLVGHGASIVSPDDHGVLGFRPVTSRTYLAVRITSLFIRTVVMTALVGYAPVMAFLLKNGPDIPGALGAIAALVATGFTVTLAIVASYGWMMRVAGPVRVMRFMSYMQFASQMVVWGGFVAMSQGLQNRLIQRHPLIDSWWAPFYPGTWFASYVRIAQGRATGNEWLFALASVLLLVLLVRSVGGKLSLDYSETLSRLTTRSVQVSAAAQRFRWPSFLRDETRAVAILVRNQFKHDMKFRLGLISLLPITLIYLFMGTQGGPPTDPFLPGEHDQQNTVFLQFALMFLPTTLRRSLVTSDAYRAAWIFHVTPADRGSLVLSARNLVTLFFLVPYLIFLAGLFTYFFHDVGHAVTHAAFLGLMSYLVLQLSVLVDPRLPFSMPVDKDTRAGLTIGIMMLVTFVGFGTYFFLVYVAYRSLLRMVVTFTALAGIAVVMDRLTRRRVAVADSLDYAG